MSGKRGRPAVENAKNITVNFRATKEERDYLNSEAKKSGLSVGRFIINKIKGII